MKRKNFILGFAALAASVLLLDGLVSFWPSRASAAEPVDLSRVRHVEVRGDASRLNIRTAGQAPYKARLVRNCSGWAALWRTSWFATDWPVSGAMRLDGTTLLVDTSDSDADFGWSDCVLELDAEVRAETSVRIEQQAAAITLAGDFSEVDIHSAAGDVNISGHAETLELSGEALRARVVFDTVRQSETIRLLGRMMDATLIFPAGVAISYVVETVASYVDSRLPNTPGAKPAILIRGDMVRATIRGK